MTSSLPVNLEGLLHRGTVESQRVELKARWDRHRTGPQVLKTICALANDYQNLNGGYIVIGVREEHGRTVLPSIGLSAEDISDAQTWLRGQCNRFDPPFRPIFFPEFIYGKKVLVVWVPASDDRPHRAPDFMTGRFRYWLRSGADTVDAEKNRGMLTEFLQQTSRTPWDDRAALDARVEDIRETTVREYLHDIRSGLLDEGSTLNIYRRMRITTRVNDHEVPRNVGLLMFSPDPKQWYRGATIEVVQFAGDRSGIVQEERAFSGSIIDQLRSCLDYLSNLSVTHIQKQRDRSQVRGWVSYPLPALRETLVNAVYHRGYDVDQPEPIKVYLFPNRLEVTSYPGPVPGIERDHLMPKANVPSAPARNRRIGEFLKELGLAEGRLTGLPKVFRTMAENGSPVPRFEFDEHRTWFRATLPAHPEYGAISALRDAAHLRTLGAHHEAFERLEMAWQENQASAVLTEEIIRALGRRKEWEQAQEVFTTFVQRGINHTMPHVANVMAEVLLDAGMLDKALKLLREDNPLALGQDAIDAAALAKRSKDFVTAHKYYQRAGDTVLHDPTALFDYAQTKSKLATRARKKRYQAPSYRRLLIEARALYERITQLDLPAPRRAWAWYYLGVTLKRLQAPVADIKRAYQNAIDLLPDPSFQNALAELQSWRPAKRKRRK